MPDATSGRNSGEGLWAALQHAFAVPSGAEFSDQERRWLEGIARVVVERNLTAPALLLVESLRPFHYVGSQALVFFQPVISVVVPPEKCEEAAALLEKRGAMEELARLIERCDAERAKPGASDRAEE